jgi:hypothetical protein
VSEHGAGSGGNDGGVKLFGLTLAVLTLLLLPACAAPETVFKPVAVDIPVAMPCRAKPPQKPVSPLAHLSKPASLFDETKAVLVELDVRKAYEDRLEAALKSCQ